MNPHRTGTLILAAVCAGLVIFRHDTLALSNAVMAALTVFAGLLPGIYFLAAGPARPKVPVVELVGTFYATFFGLTVFLQHVRRFDWRGSIVSYNHVTFESINFDAQAYVLSGLLLFYLGWVLASRCSWPGWLRLNFPRAPSQSRILAAFWLLALGHLAYIAIPEIQRIPSIGQFLLPAGFIAIVGFAALIFAGRLSFTQRIACIGIALPVWIGINVRSGFLTPMILGGLMVAVTYVWVHKKIPWRPALLSVLLFLLIYPALTEYRRIIWLEDKDRSMTAALSTLAQSVINIHRHSWTSTKPWRGTVHRTSLTLPLSYVVEKTPSSVPYWKGETYLPLVTSFIPRIFWAGKPTEKAGYAFGRRYGMIPEADPQEMSLNLPWLTELFINFGALGVFAGMAFFGFLIRALHRILTGPGQSFTGSVVAIAIIVPLTIQESNFSVMTGTLVPFALSVWVFFKIVFALPLGTGDNPAAATPEDLVS